MKMRLSFLVVLTVLMSLLFKPGAVLAQSSAPGTVVAWGWNSSGQSSVPYELGGVTAIAAGWAHSLALKADGTVVAWGSNSQLQSSVPAGLSGVTAIAAGGYHSLALKGDGTVVAWGLNNGGQSSVPAGLSGVIAIAAGGYHSLALKGDGTVVVWGWNNYGQTNIPAGLSGVTAIAAGGNHSLALKGDGTVVAWGANSYGEGSVPAGLSGVTAIASGHFHNLALKVDGTVVGWGLNSDGQTNIPAGLSGVTAIAAGGDYSLALKGDGAVVAWGWNGYGQTNIPVGLSGVTAIAAGWAHSLALISYPPTDLTITQTADLATVSTGDPVGFTITIANNSSVTAYIVTLSDTLPTAAELNWSVSGTDAAACTITAGVVSCNFGDMSPGGVKTIRLTSSTQFLGGKGFCPTIGSTANVMASNQPESKSAMAIVKVLCPSVYIQLLADNQDNQNIPAGEPVSFTTKFGNTGEGIARDVLAEIVIPTNPGLSWSISSITPAEAANNCAFGTDRFGTYELICNFEQMNPQQEVTVTLASPTTAASCGTVDSIGYLSLSNGAWVRYLMKSPIITCTADLAITQIADQETVSTGDPVGFTITTTNNGNGDTSSVTLSDTLPTAAELSWSVGGTDAAACAITAGIVSCDFGSMSPGAVKTIRLTSPTRYDWGSGFCPTISSVAIVRVNNQPEGRSATASTKVLCPDIDMQVGSNSNTLSVIAGDPISYLVVVGNTGEGIAKDVFALAELPNKPGLSWSITNVTPASAASNCTIDTGGISPGLLCLFDEMAAGQEVIITGSSPTTSRSCGEHRFYGGADISNGPSYKAKPGVFIISCTTADTVQPGTAATLTLPDGRGQIEFPADLVTLPTTFTYTEQEAPSQVLGSSTFAGLSFTLVAAAPDGNPVTSFPASYTIQLNYQDSDWQAAGIADESLLNLAYWDTTAGQWVNVLPCDGCSLDTEQNHLVVVLNHLTEFALIGSIDAEPPTTSASVSPEANTAGWNAVPVTVTLSASDSDSGIQNTEYNLNGAGWTDYSAPLVVSTESTSSTVHNTVQYRSTDNTGNVEETKSLTIQIDTTAPTVGASVPLSGYAVQGGIKFGINLADPLSGPAGASLSIREADGASGKEIGYENLAAVYNSSSGNWELTQRFDTTQIPDGFYVLVATGKDVAGNEKTEIIPFSIRNWAVLELLPSTENNKAGRTMPIKFSLRVAQEVDPAQPFVYSEELTIRIYQAGQPTPVLQSSTFGSGATDYRISAAQQSYITNFQTLKKPMQYTVEILRDALSIGRFGFQTTK